MSTPTKEEFTAAVHCLAGYAAPHEKALLADYDSTLGIRDASTEILKKTYAALEAAEERANIANRVLAAYSKVLDVLGAPAEGSDLQDLHEWAGALKKKLEAAEADGARLDWLEEAHKVQGINFAKYRSNDSTCIEHLMHSDDCEDIARGGNVREAIDAARKEAQP